MSALRITRQLPRLAAASPSSATRSFSIATRRMAEGDTGAPRSGGAAQGDAFNKREQANESKYIMEEEKKKLAALKQKIAEKEAELAKDRKEAEEIANKK